MEKQSTPVSSLLSDNKRKIRCFVAMAFGNADTDLIYNHYISNAIQDAGMIPMRVDKIIHNERIDFKIRELIEKADVVVADLTYARPSVYWEAGYAERQVPVVYTCRSDHFHSQNDDKDGNLQVHFDLKNANIITWKGTGNKDFEEKLRKRLIHVTMSLRKEIEKDSNLSLERENFSIISSEQRCNLVSSKTPSLLKKQDFQLLGDIYSGNYMSHYFSFDPKQGGRSFGVYWKKIDTVALLVLLLNCGKELTKNQLKELKVYVVQNFATKYFAQWKDFPAEIASCSSSKNEVQAIRRLVLIPVLGKVPISRVDSVFPDWHRSSNYLHYYYPKLGLFYPQAVSSSSEFLIIGNIQSISDYGNFLSKAIGTIEGERTPIIFSNSGSSSSRPRKSRNHRATKDGKD